MGTAEGSCLPHTPASPPGKGPSPGRETGKGRETWLCGSILAGRDPDRRVAGVAAAAAEAAVAAVAVGVAVAAAGNRRGAGVAPGVALGGSRRSARQVVACAPTTREEMDEAEALVDFAKHLTKGCCANAAVAVDDDPDNKVGDVGAVSDGIDRSGTKPASRSETEGSTWSDLDEKSCLVLARAYE